MELKLTDGSYAASGDGDLATVSGNAELIQRIAMRLTARRGQFAPAPDYGSRLYTLHGHHPSERESVAVQFAAEALAPERGLTVENVRITEIADGGLSLLVTVRAAEELLEIRTQI